jgi:hypothetical protein
MLQSWDEQHENHTALMRLLKSEGGLTTWPEMHRWRRRFFCLLGLALLLVGYLFVLLMHAVRVAGW